MNLSGESLEPVVKSLIESLERAGLDVRAVAVTEKPDNGNARVVLKLVTPCADTASTKNYSVAFLAENKLKMNKFKAYEGKRVLVFEVSSLSAKSNA